MTEKEFDDICCSKYHLAMIANRDGKYDHDRYGFYPIEEKLHNKKGRK